MFNCPAPFPDELLFSFVARCGWLQPLPSLKAVAERVFGTSNALAVVDLPGRLEAVHQATGLPVKALIQNHTMLPAYAPFLPPGRLAMIEQDLMTYRGGAVHFRAGIMASKVRPSKWLLYCPACAAEERATTGEAYWHRLPQATGIKVCPAHGVFLEESPARRQFRRTRHEFVSAEDVIPNIQPRSIDPADPNHRTLKRLAQSAAWLLSHPLAGNELVEMQRRYIGQAMRLGYVTGSCRVRWQDLLRDFRQRYSPALLQELQCDWTDGLSDHWLARILRRPRVVQAPIRHLLLMDFFGLTAEGFLTADFANTPFGVGPWNCENSVCPQYGRPTIDTIRLEHSHEHRLPMGVLVCPACGWTQCCVDANGKRIQWIRKHGHLWEARLAAHWADTTVSLREIARQLCVDPMTVKRYAAKASLCFPRKGKRITGKGGPPEVGRKTKDCRDAREKVRGSATAGRQPPTEVRPRVDWKERDLHLSGRVLGAKEALLNAPGRPQRISLAALARQLGAVALIQKHLERLPLTSGSLQSAVESRVGFAQRRIMWAARQLWSGDKSGKRWQLIRLAALRSDLLAEPSIADLLDTEFSKPVHISAT